MSAPHFDYFKEALTGESRWWSWIMVFWFTILGWLFVQIPITGPIPELARAADPELGAEIDRATADMMTGIDPTAAALFGLLFVGGTLLGLIGWLINRNTKDTAQKIFGILTGIGVVTSIVGLWKLMGVMNDPEANSTILKAMGVSPMAYMLFLLVFPFSLIALYLGQKFLHKRSILSLHTTAKKIRWSRGLQAFCVTWVVLGSLTAVGHFTGLSPINTNFDAGRFLIYALVSLIFIPMQSGTEEIVFRGYLNQGFAHILKNKWVAFIITSALFACMHLSNPEALKGAEDGILLLTMSSYFFFGFVACLMVWMDDGLESAIGFHAANNTFAAIFVNYEGSVLPTPSLFMATPNTVIDVPTTLLAMGLIAAILYKTRKPLDMTFA
ncbi:CPBP family intramembrane glutamic endopeptidase [Hellea balneolensis]|uniref:CPBP family intramembrane glutamic endopeptidase n=1 Tax=Hellea balneolensis TaxID=287478 RepID=UPI0003FD8073|nr:CPBP family intramembrane glutamic endopeptidase [Hellea balneolensis]